MIPGTVSKISEQEIAAAAEIFPKTDLIHVTDTAATTAIATIQPPYGGFSGILLIANRSGNPISTVTTGNIVAARTVPDNFVMLAVYSKETGTWIPGAIS